MATALEASVALENADGAWTWLGRYIRHEEADGFELSSTERQLKEVWGLTIDSPLGKALLPVLEAEALRRKFGQVALPGTEVAKTIEQTRRLEKVLGPAAFVSLSWYRLGLERCRAVAQVRNEVGDGIGTGFLVRGSALAPALGDELLLLTNAHVISDDPAVQRDKQALPPDEAVVTFEALETVAGRTRGIQIQRIIAAVQAAGIAP